MHTHCKTEYAVLLIGIPDEKGVLRFPNNGKQWPGIVFEPKPLLAINDQLVSQLKSFLGWEHDPKIEVNHDYGDVTDDQYTLYLANLVDKEIKAKDSWQSMPELLRGMDRNRKRLPFLRAFQVLTGGLNLNTKALENADIGKLVADENKSET